jgi:hypothetical protein
VPTGARKCFFWTDLAFGAILGVFGDRQWCQINIEPEPLVSEAMVQSLAFFVQESSTGLAQLLNLLGSKTVQGARQGRLVGKLEPSPGTRECQIRAQASIDLMNRTTAGQNADQHIQQFRGGSVFDRFLGQMDCCEHRPQKGGSCQTVTQHTQRGKLGLVWHGHQSDYRAHLGLLIWCHKQSPS